MSKLFVFENAGDGNNRYVEVELDQGTVCITDSPDNENCLATISRQDFYEMVAFVTGKHAEMDAD